MHYKSLGKYDHCIVFVTVRLILWCVIVIITIGCWWYEWDGSISSFLTALRFIMGEVRFSWDSGCFPVQVFLLKSLKPEVKLWTGSCKRCYLWWRVARSLWDAERCMRPRHYLGALSSLSGDCKHSSYLWDVRLTVWESEVDRNCWRQTAGWRYEETSEWWPQLGLKATRDVNVK